MFKSLLEKRHKKQKSKTEQDGKSKDGAGRAGLFEVLRWLQLTNRLSSEAFFQAKGVTFLGGKMALEIKKSGSSLQAVLKSGEVEVSESSPWKYQENHHIKA